MLTAPRPQVVVLGLLVIGVLWAMYAVEKAERQTLQRSDEAKARQDDRHRVKQWNSAVRVWWFGFSKRWLAKSQGKRARTKAQVELHKLIHTNGAKR